MNTGVFIWVTDIQALAAQKPDAEDYVKFALVLIVLVCWLVMNGIKLCRAVSFYRDVKAQPTGEPELTPAVITGAWRRRHQRYSTLGARAAYQYNGEAVDGRMICAYDERLEKDQKVDVIVYRRSGSFFALSIKQIKNAVLTYAVYTGVTLLLAAGGISGIVIEIINSR